MRNSRYDPLPCSGQWSEQLHDPFWSEKKARSKARIDRALEQKKKKSRVEEGVNAYDSKYEEETTADVIIPMDNDGLGIDPYTKVIPPYMVLTYESDDDRNIKSNSNSDYETKDDDDDDLGAK